MNILCHRRSETARGVCPEPLRAAKPSDVHKDKIELPEVRRENLGLRAELSQANEERDILKKAAAYFARTHE